MHHYNLKLINIDFRSPQLKRKCIETALIISPTNHLHEKNPSPEKWNTDWEAKWKWVEHILLILMKSEKNPAIYRTLPRFADKLKPDAIQYENKLLTKLHSEELVNLSFEDFLSNVSTFMKRLQSHKKRHWILSHKQKIRQKEANAMN